MPESLKTLAERISWGPWGCLGVSEDMAGEATGSSSEPVPKDRFYCIVQVLSHQTILLVQRYSPFLRGHGGSLPMPAIAKCGNQSHPRTLHKHTIASCRRTLWSGRNVRMGLRTRQGRGGGGELLAAKRVHRIQLMTPVGAFRRSFCCRPSIVVPTTIPGLGASWQQFKRYVTRIRCFDPCFSSHGESHGEKILSANGDEFSLKITEPMALSHPGI